MFFFILTLTVSCGDNTQEKAEELLRQAQKECDNGNYDKTLALIDTLRNKYPKAIETRKKALVLHADASEKQAKKRLDDIMVELDKAEAKYSALNKTVTEHKKSNKAKSDELTELTIARMHRDSIRTSFEAECEKIKYIRKQRQKGLN